jgi:hypothetical protein
MLNKPKTYAALIRSLEYCVNDYAHNNYDLEWDNWYLRDIVEQDCLLVLMQLCGFYGPDGLIKAKFIERWLAKEPWGESTEERQLRFMDILEKGNQSKLNELLLPLVQSKAGRRQLEKWTLIPKTVSPPRSSASDTRMINGEDTAGEDYQGMSMERRRRRNQTTDEDRLRRRHRQAMVLNDGSRPLGRGDIIEQNNET